MNLVWIYLLAYVRLCVGQYRDVVIDQGTVRGYVDDGVYRFFGIPYATAPTGEDRFKGPLPAPTWTVIFNANESNIICPQREIFADTFLTLDRRIDCLRADVFIPDTNETNLPVLVNIPGGALQEGYKMKFNPTALVKRGLIAVNFNYRVGVHGFLCLGTEFAPGNAGFKDQVEALKWVKRNIASFGGDPDNITLGGNSAGGMSVEFQILSELSNGLFNRAIPESGSALASSVMLLNTLPLELAQSFATQFGVTTSQDPSDLEAVYRFLTNEQLNTGYIGDLATGFMGCLESHDIPGIESFIRDLPSDILRSGNYEKRALLSGFTTMEGIEFIHLYDDRRPLMEADLSGYLPTNIQYDSEEHRQEVVQKVKDFYFPTGEVTHLGYIEFYSDIIFTYPQMVSSRLHARNAVDVYLYLFNFNGTVNLPSAQTSPVWGPGHIAQSMYVQEFDYAPVYDNMTEDDFLVQERLREMWVNFIKYGVPIPARTTTSDVDWSPVTEDAHNYLNIDIPMTFGQDPLAERFALWDEVYGFTNAPDSAHSLSLSIILFLICIVRLIIN